MSDLQQKLRDSAGWLIALADDLRDGRAQEIPTDNPHFMRHPVQVRDLLPEDLWHEAARLKVGEPIFEICLDPLKLWGVYLRIADCERTGKRFIAAVPHSGKGG